MQDKKLYDAEYRFMDIIWELEPVNSTKLARACEARLGWKKPTAYNMLRKLAEKGLVQNESAMVTALVKREEVRRAESEALMERAFGGQRAPVRGHAAGGAQANPAGSGGIKTHD